MVKYLLKITAVLENLTNLQPQGGFDDFDFVYLFKLKCEWCGEVSQKEIGVTLNVTNISHPIGKGKPNLARKCKLCERIGTITMIPDRGQPLTLETSESEKYVPLMLFDVSGYEPVDYVFGPSWRAESMKGTKFENIDLSSGKFAEYDEKGKCPRVVIYDLRSTFDVVY
ncbi:hypothetical protein O6P43_015931 [Quillaja saponaria]|uniref:CXXC motif containing zinc binding protein n=1 Tax=Quillaja saponaria TaxID=32244 RepID=A0AAD7PTE5_QUISA|nr:hypothetical protein O6P43_015931 [Quillaja saponaria]